MTYSKEEKVKWLKSWRRSGKKAWTYAKENGIAPQTFVNWVKKDGKAGFVELTPKRISAGPDIPEISIEKGDVKLNIPATTSMDNLQEIFKLLGVIQ